ncbi:MAG: DNA recombination protein RmuC [Actinomycetaceae bacterium]|nr:DNA recombination protein RmuC [Actinomycetaceae bacterium]
MGEMFIAVIGMLIALIVGIGIGAVIMRDRLSRDFEVTTARLQAQVESSQQLVDEATAARHHLDRELEARRRAEEDARIDVVRMLGPISARLQDMSTAVAQMERDRSTQYGALDEQMRWARESDRELRQMTQALGAALRNSSMRGSWGEAQLRTIVESAGLLERVHFNTQVAIDTPEGKGRPDMVIYLPGNKAIPVDAKVPFDSYLEAVAIPENADGEEAHRRQSLMKSHVKAVRRHIDALAQRRYWDGLEGAPELVIAFIPSESLLSSAYYADPSLMEYAFSKHVALASPVSLMSVLRTIEYSWRQDQISRQAGEILDLARDLYSRLSVVGGHVQKMRKSLEEHVKAWNSFAASFESRFLVAARRLDHVDGTRQIDTVEEVVEPIRMLSSPELSGTWSLSTDEGGVASSKHGEI